MLTQRECQHCGDAVDLLEAHTAATLWSSHTETAGRIMYKPVFCDRWCWLDWLRTAESA